MITIDETVEEVGITLHVMSDCKKPEQLHQEKRLHQKNMKEVRKQRLAAALRDNLLKRKAQMRARLDLDKDDIKTPLEESRKIA